MSKDTLSVTDNSTGKTTEFPILRGVHGNPTVDISSLPKDLGYFTFDPGFVSTASCKSDITFIDGEKGILRTSTRIPSKRKMGIGIE